MCQACRRKLPFDAIRGNDPAMLGRDHALSGALAFAALGPSLQTVGITWGYYLFYAAPYIVTLVVLIITARGGRSLRGMPGQLSIGR